MLKHKNLTKGAIPICSSLCRWEPPTDCWYKQNRLVDSTGWVGQSMMSQSEERWVSDSFGFIHKPANSQMSHFSVDGLNFPLLTWFSRFMFCLQCGFFVRQRELQTAAVHQGRILGKDKQQQYTDPDGFLIRGHASLSENSNSPKHWVTSWTETHWETVSMGTWEPDRTRPPTHREPDQSHTAV